MVCLVDVVDVVPAVHNVGIVHVVNVVDAVHNVDVVHVVDVVDAVLNQSCKMSQIWQIYLCKNIGRLG